MNPNNRFSNPTTNIIREMISENFHVQPWGRKKQNEIYTKAEEGVLPVYFIFPSRRSGGSSRKGAPFGQSTLNRAVGNAKNEQDRWKHSQRNNPGLLQCVPHD